MDIPKTIHLFQTEEAYQILKDRKNLLHLLLKEEENKILNFPEGSLHVVTGNRKKPQYYHRINSSDKSGKYIRKSDHWLAEQLAQKGYTEKLITQIQEEIKMLEKLSKHDSQNNIFTYYDSLPDTRRKLVVPSVDSDEMFVKHWLEEEYSQNYMDDSKKYVLNENEAVRSKSEYIIANLLHENGIPYKYEYPLIENGVIWARPDFTVLNVRRRKQFYWEHFGMMDVEDYLNSMLKKIYRYGRRGFYPGKNLIVTFESSQNALNTKYVEDVIKEFLL